LIETAGASNDFAARLTEVALTRLRNNKLGYPLFAKQTRLKK